jgi:hypothetical protein
MKSSFSDGDNRECTGGGSNALGGSNAGSSASSSIVASSSFGGVNVGGGSLMGVTGSSLSESSFSGCRMSTLESSLSSSVLVQAYEESSEVSPRYAVPSDLSSQLEVSAVELMVVVAVFSVMLFDCAS